MTLRHHKGYNFSWWLYQQNYLYIRFNCTVATLGMKPGSDFAAHFSTAYEDQPLPRTACIQKNKSKSLSRITPTHTHTHTRILNAQGPSGGLRRGRVLWPRPAGTVPAAAPPSATCPDPACGKPGPARPPPPSPAAPGPASPGVCPEEGRGGGKKPEGAGRPGGSAGPRRGQPC